VLPNGKERERFSLTGRTGKDHGACNRDHSRSAQRTSPRTTHRTNRKRLLQIDHDGTTNRNPSPDAKSRAVTGEVESNDRASKDQGADRMWRHQTYSRRRPRDGSAGGYAVRSTGPAQLFTCIETDVCAGLFVYGRRSFRDGQTHS